LKAIQKFICVKCRLFFKQRVFFWRFIEFSINV
jgi:hypothetical protein